MGRLKELHTLIHAPGGKQHRAAGARAEAEILEEVRTSLTDRDFNWWLRRNHARAWGTCTACPLRHGRTCVVAGRGDPYPDVMIVGDAPSEEEDALGRTFLGPPADLLRRVGDLAGLELSRAWVTTAVSCRPPRDRRPERAERLACQPRLEEELDDVRPRVLLLLGQTAANWIGVRDLDGLRGLVPRERWPSLGLAAVTRLRAVVLTQHPRVVLAQPTREAKKLELERFLADLRVVARAVDRAKKSEAS